MKEKINSFFDRLKKETEAHSCGKMAQLLSVDFGFLKVQSDVARKVFISFLYLKKKFKKVNKPIPEIINSAIMNIKLRKRVQLHVSQILRLV